MTDLRTAPVIAAGWYPDPADASALRWWSGETWTEHSSPAVHSAGAAVAAEPAAAPTTPITPESDAYLDRPDFTRFSRDPLVVGQPTVGASVTSSTRRKDPYRERHIFSGVAV
ncbi:MAG TPA: DUF2510 domain-containing protein, partial [Pseudolysinimonas sp.]